MPENPYTHDPSVVLLIREWLQAHPLPAGEELSIYEVPETLFEAACSDNRLTELNRRIHSLSLNQQQLLHYLSRDIDTALIIESMNYASPELFWLDRATLVRELDTTARKQDVLQVFRINDQLVEAIYEVADQIDIEDNKVRDRKYRIGFLLAAPLVLLIAIVFLYPVLRSPDPAALYEKYSGAYRPDPAAVDTTASGGLAWQEALIRLGEEDFSGAADWLEEGITGEGPYRTGSRWFLALISLQQGNREGCRNQLDAIRREDPAFFTRYAAKLWKEVRRGDR